MNKIDQKYTELMQQKEQMRAWMSNVYRMDPARRKKYLAKHGMSEEDFGLAAQQEAKAVEGGEPAGGSLGKETEARKESVGVEEDPWYNDPVRILLMTAGIGAAGAVGIGGGIPIISSLLYSILLGKEAGLTAGLSGAGPALQEIVDLIGSLSNPVGEEKILAEHGPEVLGKIKNEMSSEANVKILEKLVEGIKSGEITPEKAPMKMLSRLKGILKAPNDEELRALKAGFVSPTTEEELFKAQSRRINRINHLLEVMKNSGQQEIQLLHGVLADEMLKYMQLATNEITQIDNAGKTIFRNAKIEWSPEQLDEFKKFFDRTEFPGAVNRVINSAKKANEGLGEVGSSQLISDISSRFYTFGKSILGEKGSIPQRLYQAEVHAQMMDPNITLRKLETDVSFIPWQRLMQSVAIGVRYRSFSTGQRQFLAAMSAYFKAYPEAWKIMKASIASGEPEFDKLLVSGLTKGEARKLGFQNAHYALEGFDLTDPGMLNNYMGSWYATGSHAVMGADQFAAVLARRSAMRMLATEHALEELEAKGLKGPKLIILAEEQAERDMKKPPDWLIQSQNEDMYKTKFTDSGKWISEMTDFTRRHPWAKAYFEFIRTPMNLFKEGLRHTPLGLVPGKVFGDEGIEATATQAKAVVGSVICKLVYDATLRGEITGSGPTNPRHYNMVSKEPYTMYGYSYKHLKPIGTLIAMCADAAENMANIKDPTDKNQMTTAVMKAAAQTVSNIPTMTGMTNLFQAMDEAKNGKAYGLDKILSQKAAGFIPAPIKEFTNIIDPEQRQQGKQTVLQLPETGNVAADFLIDRAQSAVNGIINTLPIRNGIPYRKWDATPQYLPPGVDADGTAPDAVSVANSMFNPFASIPDPEDDLDRELEKHGIEFNRPPKAISVGNQIVPLSNDQQDRWNVLSGREIRIGPEGQSMNQRERGNYLISQDTYKNAAPEDQKVILKGNHELFEGRAHAAIEQELRGAPPAFTKTEDFPAQPLDKGPSSPPSLGE